MSATAQACSQGAGLRRTVGLWRGVALYGGAVLGTGVLVLPAIAAETAGPASILAWLALVLLSLPLALTYAALSSERPDAAGFSGAIERAFGARWGGVAGWLFLAQVPTGTVVAALVAGEYAASCFGGGREAVFAFGGGLVLVAYLLNLAGLRVSSAAQTVTLAVIALGLAVLVGRALQHVEPAAFSPFLPHGTKAVGGAAVKLFWAFVGWEAITPLAEEFREPRDIRRASLLAVAAVGVLYLSLAVAAVGTRAYGPGVTAPIVVLAGRTLGSSAPAVVGAAGFLLCFIPLNAYVAGTSRLAYALGRRRQLPAWLDRTSATGTPRNAILALFALSAAALAVAYAARLRIADLLPLSTSSFLATYVLSMAAAARLLRPPLRHAAVVALVACAAVLVFVGPLFAWIAGVCACSLAYQRLAGGVTPSLRSPGRARATGG